MTFLSNISKFFGATVEVTPPATTEVKRTIGGRWAIMRDGRQVEGTMTYATRNGAVRGAARQGINLTEQKPGY